jgi:hypothetical protein
MRLVRRIAMTVLVWATVSSMLFASTPYYVCRCPDGTTKMHLLGSVSPESPCCTSQCCASPAKAKPCCQASKKTTTKPNSCSRIAIPQTKNPNGSPSVGQSHCQKSLVQAEQRSFCRLEVKPLETPNDAFALTVCVDLSNISGPATAATTLWRIDKIPPPTDLVTVLHRLTI